MKRIFISALLALPLGATAQTITFDTEEKEYQAVGVYDTWEESPFRTGLLTGNTAVVTNPVPSANNETANVLAVQRSRFGSNTFGARIDLPQTFELGTEVQYVHVLIHKPTEGRVMLIGLGKRRERAGQSSETEQFWALSRTKVKAGEWADAVFAIKGAGGIDIYSLVVVPDCESPHDLTADYMCYIDEVQFAENATSRTASEDYPINIEEGATYNH
ncbi:MAG: glycoside hydrolase family 16 protein, partial [Alloprevotella sp.]|nr:glycoside hydrolase family 16 protein [Alloprevotella sp.]